MAAPLLIPVKLDAFVLNPSVCDGGPSDAAIAPIVQPDYSGLTLDPTLLRNDVLDPIDLHHTAPSSVNPRITDLGTGKLRQNRIGVYLHWTIPRFYRTGIAVSPSAAAADQTLRQKKGFSTAPGPGAQKDGDSDFATPDFRQLPNRWLIVRKLNPDAASTTPQGAPIPAIEAWVIESDRLRRIGRDETLDHADLQVDVSPYTSPNVTQLNGMRIEDQVGLYLGYRQTASDWVEDYTQARGDLTVASSSNPLFVDYQLHCSGVFSLVDTFSYQVNEETRYLESCVANYYILGWHSNPEQGPLGASATGLTREQRLEALSMVLGGSPPWPPEITAWLDSCDAAPILCHGALYQVVWDAHLKPQKDPADQFAQNCIQNMPLAVGTTPMDALLAYIDAHHDGPFAQLENDLRLIEPLLRAQDDGVEALQAATDEVQNGNHFTRTAGGVHWHFQSPEDDMPAVSPSESEVANLETLNQLQRMVDAVFRQLRHLRWRLFTYWWRWVSLTWEQRNTVHYPVHEISQDISGLETLATALCSRIQTMSTDQTLFRHRPEPGVQPEFYQGRDPTLLIAGTQAGWPDDYLDPLTVRLQTQVVITSPSFLSPSPSFCIDRLPADLRSAATALVAEFLSFERAATPSPGQCFPLYHDHGKHGDATGPLRDQWGETQPWFPLFIEWEAEYVHIPWEDWSLQQIKGSVTLDDPEITDTRSLSGRIFLLPQPNFSLQAAIDQLFNSVDPSTLAQYLPTQEQRDEVRYRAYQLPFLSAPLDGFTDHLLTRMHGAHIQPNARYPQQGIRMLQDALDQTFTWDVTKQIGIQSDITPYGSLVPITTITGGFSPFKPVTHGQFRFTKLNIIDRFGQAIPAIDDTHAAYPCISQGLAPQIRADGQPNVVRKPIQPGHCEFVQIPPQINQPARLNAVFVVHDERQDADPDRYSYWRPVTEWENPIWGWVVVNYVEHGLQLFLPDGTFYREVRISSPSVPTVTTVSAKWLPFPPPENAPETTQLDRLIAKFLEPDQNYFYAFLNMVNASLESSPSPPSAYASFLPSAVGRPLAFVNAGWSLELASEPYANQSCQPGQDPKPPERNLTDYDFPVQLGGGNGTPDGMVGYWTSLQAPTPANELDLSTIYTYHTDPSSPSSSPSASSPLEQLDITTFPRLNPFWIPPASPSPTSSLPTEYLEDAARLFTKTWTSTLHVFGLTINPFSPISAYASTVPPTKLTLPPWTWQNAMQKMTAFFHMGPILLIHDVGKYWDENKTLSREYRLNPPEVDQTVPGSEVGVPALLTAEWSWLQPYSKTKNGEEEEEYMALGLGKVDKRPGLEKGPYTAVEGYLQLKRAIVTEGEEKK